MNEQISVQVLRKHFKGGVCNCNYFAYTGGWGPEIVKIVYIILVRSLTDNNVEGIISLIF